MQTCVESEFANAGRKRHLQKSLTSPPETYRRLKQVRLTFYSLLLLEFNWRYGVLGNGSRQRNRLCPSASFGFRFLGLPSHFPDPLAILPNRFEGSDIARIENIFRCRQDFSFFEIVPGVAGADGYELQHARVPVTINHASRAAVSNELRLVEFVDVAHRLLPKVASIKIQVPIEIKVFVTAKAAEFFPVLTQVTLHFRQRFGRIDDRKSAPFLHFLNFLENLDQFLGLVVHQAGIAEAQVAGSQIGQRIAEGAAFEAQFCQKIGQFVVIIDELASRDTRSRLDVQLLEHFIGAFDFAADLGQATVFFVFGDVMSVDRHDDAAQAVTGEGAHVLLGPKGAVGANHGADAPFGGIARHCPQVLVNQGFSADKKQVADVVFGGDVDDIARFLKGDAPSLFGVEAIHGEATKIALGIANIGDRELQIARTAVIEHISDELGPAGSRQDDVPQRLRLSSWGRWLLRRV